MDKKNLNLYLGSVCPVRYPSPKRHSIALWPTERSNYPNIHFFPSDHWGKQKIIKMFSSLCAIFARMRVTDGTKKVTDRTDKVTDRTPHRLCHECTFTENLSAVCIHMSETSVNNAETSIKNSHMGPKGCIIGERVTDGTKKFYEHRSSLVLLITLSI